MHSFDELGVKVECLDDEEEAEDVDDERAADEHVQLGLEVLAAEICDHIFDVDACKYELPEPLMLNNQ